ncbi:hypothetical protein OTU49_002120 [Cherax quadricarinatus]|uniref:Uncharacterized protein n=1 Tax=Cherax quadricarinatus TaxID=27406 RepID=A0AAW0XCJ6_CHEQU
MVPYSLCIAVLFCTLAWADECAWDRDVDFSENPPIIFDESFEIVRPVLEDNYRMVRVTAGSKLILDCPGTNITSLAVTTVEATCDGGRNLWIDDKTWEMKDLGCTAEAAATIRRNTGSCGSEDIGVIHIIGFEILGPESFYELVIHDEARQQAVAVVGVNNPHLTTAPTRLCDDLCDRLTWINFDISDLVHGFTYCCTVDDLRQAVPHVPDLGDVELLTE